MSDKPKGLSEEQCREMCGEETMDGPDYRPNHDEYFMEFARTAAKRATCPRGRSGAALVKDKQIISTGYVGAAAGLPHCDEVGCLIRSVDYEDGSTHKHCMRTAHAEGNAIIQAAKHGISTKGATLYCKMEPCLRCCVDIINAGIVRVVAEYEYHGAELTREWFKEAGVELVVLNAQPADYEDKWRRGPEPDPDILGDKYE